LLAGILPTLKGEAFSCYTKQSLQIRVSGPPSLCLAAARVFPDIKGRFPSRAPRGSRHRAVGHNAKENGQGLTPLPANVRRWAVWSSERPAQGGRSF